MAEENKQENKVFLVRVEETLVADVFVEAASYEEAQEKVEEKYHNQELVLDYTNYGDTSYSFPEEYSLAKFREEYAGHEVSIINTDNELVSIKIEPVQPEIRINQNISSGIDWDFSQFTEEQYNLSKARGDVINGQAIHENNEDKPEVEQTFISDIEFANFNNDMFIKYKDLYIVPRLMEPAADTIECFIDVYIPKNNLLQVSDIGAVSKEFNDFNPYNLHNPLYNQIFIDRSQGKLTPVECVSVACNRIGVFTEDLMENENVFLEIKKFISEVDPKRVLNNIKPYLDERARSEEKSNRQIRNGTGLTEQEFRKLVESGDWHIDEEAYKKVIEKLRIKGLGEPANIEDGEHIGYVAFGNDFYTMNIYKDIGADDPDQYVCEMQKLSPSDGTYSDEIKEFRFDTIFVNELDYNYVSYEDEVCASFVVTATSDLNEFQDAAVEMLVYCDEINYDLQESYMFIKESEKSFYRQLKTRENTLNLLGAARKKLPTDIIKKEKLEQYDWEQLADYYKKIKPLIYEGKDTFLEDRLMVKEMIFDGLSDMRIKTIAGIMAGGLTAKGSEYSTRLSGVLHESSVKAFREQIEYNRTHTGHPEKQR